jgi:hypothetical protein
MDDHRLARYSRNDPSIKVIRKPPLGANLFVGTRRSVRRRRITPRNITYIPGVERLVPPRS